MYKRSISLAKDRSFFLFGQRGTGKTTILKEIFEDRALYIDLLDSKTYLKLNNAPWRLREIVLGKRNDQGVVIIDEIQKIPSLLDEVHKLIEEKKLCFALTGSSARKLKREGINLLAGRAYAYKLFPLTSLELGNDFNLKQALQWGTLPSVVVENNPQYKEEYLYAYVNTFLKEEIILEQAVRQIEPFSRFLEVAAQSNTKVISFANIAKDVGISSVSVKTYFNILVDTLIGFFLPAYHTSIRKRQKQAAKFYFHDLGIVRSLQNITNLEPIPETFAYGTLFESFVVNEIIRLNEYKRTRFEFSHLRVDDKYEIDLIIERPGKKNLLVEIKSSKSIKDNDLKTLETILPSFKNAEALCLSQDEERKKISNVLCLPWAEGLEEIFR